MPYRVIDHPNMERIIAGRGLSNPPKALPEVVETFLNISHEDGWRLVGIDPHGYSGVSQYVLFKED